MVEPIQVPSATQPPMFALGNITGSPITTIAGIAAAIAQYLATQGPNMPHDAAGWASFAGGLVLAVLLAVFRGTGKATTVAIPLLLAITLSACKGGGTAPPATATPGASAQIVSTLVVGAASLGCTFIPAVDRPAVSLGLSAFISLLATDPAAALDQANDPASTINANSGMGMVWAAIHSQLDNLGANGWSTYGVSLLKSAATACVQAIA